jgi:hypothetical protein
MMVTTTTTTTTTMMMLTVTVNMIATTVTQTTTAIIDKQTRYLRHSRPRGRLNKQGIDVVAKMQNCFNIIAIVGYDDVLAACGRETTSAEWRSARGGFLLPHARVTTRGSM